MKVYKIRNAQGLFSTGGTRPRWTRTGKTWTQLNHVLGHLTLLRNERHRAQERVKDPRIMARMIAMYRDAEIDKTKDIYEQCVVVEFDATPAKETAVLDGKMV